MAGMAARRKTRPTPKPRRVLQKGPKKLQRDALMRECWLAFWHPETIDPITGKTPEWREAAAHVRVKLGGEILKEGCCHATLYNSRAWAVERNLPVRDLHSRGRHGYKLDPLKAFAMCEAMWGPIDSRSARTKRDLAEQYGVSVRAAYESYRPRYLDGSLAREAAAMAAKAS